MARSKQAAPLRREPSDLSHEIPKSPDHRLKQANGHAAKSLSKTSNGKPKEPAPQLAQEPAGLPQLVICVGGIYISL